jgi:hypothetical protein
MDTRLGSIPNPDLEAAAAEAGGTDRSVIRFRAKGAGGRAKTRETKLEMRSERIDLSKL